MYLLHMLKYSFGIEFQFRFGFGSVILTKTETTDLPIFEHFVGEMDFRKREKINFCLVFNILI